MWNLITIVHCGEENVFYLLISFSSLFYYLFIIMNWTLKFFRIVKTRLLLNLTRAFGLISIQRATLLTRIQLFCQRIINNIILHYFIYQVRWPGLLLTLISRKLYIFISCCPVVVTSYHMTCSDMWYDNLLVNCVFADRIYDMFLHCSPFFCKNEHNWIKV